MGKTLVVLGAGPGIGSATAAYFAAALGQQFTHIALVSRSESSLQSATQGVLAAADAAGSRINVKSWQCGFVDSVALKKCLVEIEEYAELGGGLECVVFNPARVGPSQLFEFEDVQILEDFQVCQAGLKEHVVSGYNSLTYQVTNIALYHVSAWAIPLLKAQATNPCLLVTNSKLYNDPIPPLFSLCLTKTAQRNLVQCMQMEFGKEVHIALLAVVTPVSDDAKNTNRKRLAAEMWNLYAQTKGEWDGEVFIEG
jgi:NAD(P)-dependent dehydrogenase (short-subunit alcohol dehydrogenase family)